LGISVSESFVVLADSRVTDTGDFMLTRTSSGLWHLDWDLLIADLCEVLVSVRTRIWNAKAGNTRCRYFCNPTVSRGFEMTL
jgi:hypothetical protein